MKEFLDELLDETEKVLSLLEPVGTWDFSAPAERTEVIGLILTRYFGTERWLEARNEW